MKKIFAVVFSFGLLFSPFNAVFSQMESANFRIPADTVGVGGQSQTSGSFLSWESIGEMGTGDSRSANYITDAGFWAMIGSEDALTINITDNSAELGTLDKNNVRYDTAAFQAATTFSSGYAVQFYGDSLSTGSHDIAPLSSPVGSAPGNEQFGFNLRLNTDPNIGDDPSGGTGQAVLGYNTPDAYKFNSGDTIAETSGQSVYTDYTMSFISNITGASDAGNYSTDLSVVITGKF